MSSPPVSVIRCRGIVLLCVSVSLSRIASFPVFVAVFLKTASYFHLSKMCLLLCVTETVTCCNVLMTRTCNDRCVPENVCVMFSCFNDVCVLMCSRGTYRVCLMFSCFNDVCVMVCSRKRVPAVPVF